MHDEAVQAKLDGASRVLEEVDRVIGQVDPDLGATTRDAIEEAIGVVRAALKGGPLELRGDVAAAHALLFRRRFSKDDSLQLFAAVAELRDYLVELEVVARNAKYPTNDERTLPREDVLAKQGREGAVRRVEQSLDALRLRLRDVDSTIDPKALLDASPPSQEALQAEMFENARSALDAKAVIGIALTRDDNVDLLGLSHSIDGIERTSDSLMAIASIESAALDSAASSVVSEIATRAEAVVESGDELFAATKYRARMPKSGSEVEGADDKPPLFGEPGNLRSEVVSVGALFAREQHLQVPRYQRPYTWSPRSVAQLIQDLRRSFEARAAVFFMGQIILLGQGDGRAEVADGGQRLATVVMVLAYARDRLPQMATELQSLIMREGQPRLLMREEDRTFFQGFVQEPGHFRSLIAAPQAGIAAKDALVDGARAIGEELDTIGDRDLKKFIRYLLASGTVNVVYAAEREVALAAVNASAGLGAPLLGSDILKTDLLERSGLSNEEANAAARKWAEIESALDREDFLRLLSLLPFLLSGESGGGGDLKSFRRAVQHAGGPRQFLFEVLPRFAAALRAILASNVDAGEWSKDVNRRLTMMKQLEEWDWAPAAIAFLAYCGDEHDRAPRFFQALDRMAYACMLDVIDSRARDARYAQIASNVDDDEKLFGSLGALNLTDIERMKFVATLNRSRKRERFRRLLLIRVEAALPGGNVLKMTDDVTVEHILPKSGGEFWNNFFPDVARRSEAANLLGNLTLVTYAQNLDAATSAFENKKRILFNTPGAPIHALTRDIANIDAWTDAEIEARHERLVWALFRDWGL